MYDLCADSYVKPIQKDGNCLFYAVSYCMDSTEDRHSVIRLKTVNEIINFLSSEVAFALFFSTEAYLVEWAYCIKIYRFLVFSDICKMSSEIMITSFPSNEVNLVEFLRRLHLDTPHFNDEIFFLSFNLIGE